MQNHMTLSTDRVDHVNGARTCKVGGNGCVYEYENDHIILTMIIIIVSYVRVSLSALYFPL